MGPQVLIVGAGPTGLVLALLLTRLGVRIRIIDKAATPGTTSRALVVHARTLEFYRQIGIDDEVVRLSLRFSAANLWASGRHAARIVFGDMGRGLSAFPYMLVFPQDEHEALLIERLAQKGVTVERPTELVSLSIDDDGVRAELRLGDGTTESCNASYVAGADGAHSRVRESLGVEFPGGTYEHLFYVADVDASGPVVDGELHLVLDDADFLGVFPLKANDRLRLIGTVRDEMAAKQDILTWSDVSSRVVDRARVDVEKVNWFSTYHVHHRVADRFRVGRAFLLGDAAHIHSPVGGQGMNTGIGDAVNLAWKLAQVIAGADARLLTTYQPERMAFAKRLVRTTDRAFTFVTKRGPIARRVRMGIVPILLPWLFRLPRVRRLMFRTVSQIAINYRGSALSLGRAGTVHGGDRLPWVQADPAMPSATDNYAPLASLEWQVHVYGVASQPMLTTCRKHQIPLYELPWSVGARRAGIQRDAAYLMRPDGYVAIAIPNQAPAVLATFLAEWKLGRTSCS